MVGEEKKGLEEKDGKQRMMMLRRRGKRKGDIEERRTQRLWVEKEKGGNRGRKKMRTQTPRVGKEKWVV